MNRRQAIGRIVLAGLGSALAIGGYEWYERNRTPDLSFLDKSHALVAALADTIIPPTAAPGAVAAGVPDCLVRLLRDCADRHTQNNFIDGLRSIDAHCQSAYGHGFADCAAPDRVAALTRSERKDRPLTGIWGKAENRFLGKPFFTTLKEYTVIAYCTSEQGATHGLAYVGIPVHYQGCLPWQPGQPAWATK
ncbi:MAG TPA: gluconate 2-dehydrogenase subunit 3 family protein [Puia sp.]|nr:gluconate 2-dehydrogenase subunit 3 family protein [Puia sp.]